MKKSRSQTKNLVILYQKLFNLGLRKYQCGNSDLGPIPHINIRKCAGVGSFRDLLIKYPKIKKIMNELLESGELLENLVKWKGHHANMAISLKYFNKMIDIILNPDCSNTTWTGEIKVRLQPARTKSTIDLETIDLSPNAGTDPFSLPVEHKEHIQFPATDIHNNPTFSYDTSQPFILECQTSVQGQKLEGSQRFEGVLEITGSRDSQNFIDECFSF